MLLPEPLKAYRLYIAMFIVNLAVIIGIIYLLRREPPTQITVTQPPTRPAPNVTQKQVSLITVSVSGAVEAAGTLQLDGNARLADALQKAGLGPEADVSKLNLTLPLNDGDKIVVPSRPTSVPALNNLAVPPATPTSRNPPAVSPSGKLNLNTATLEQLDALPGIGSVLAQRILDYRAQHGAFKSIQELKDVKGIGDALYDDIQDKVTVQ